MHVTDGAPRDGHDARNYGFATVADYAAARRRELDAALRAGDAARLRRLGLGIPDKEASQDLAGLARRIAETLRVEQPVVVFTHAYEGGHPDHDAAAFAVYAACRLVDAPPAIVEMPFYHRRDGPACDRRISSAPLAGRRLFIRSRSPEKQIAESSA